MGMTFWLKKWQKQDVPFNQKEVNPVLPKYIDRLNIKPGDTVLVPLCGKSIDMLWLADQGFKVFGIELSPIACHDFFIENHLQVTITEDKSFIHYQHEGIEILCGDFFALSNADCPTIKAVYDRASLIALPPKIQLKYAEIMAKLLAKDVHMLTITIETDSEVQGPPYPVSKASMNSLFDSNFSILELSREPEVKISPHLEAIGYHDMTDVVYILTRN